jgi:HD superfamily phosphohydrolase
MIFLKKSKIFKDVIHDSIQVTKIANAIIDTKIFQRLRNLHQLGVCYMVFQNANNNRFEHSIGTYYLAEKFLNNLVINSDYKEINNSIIQINFIKKYLLKNLELTDTEENITFIKNSETLLLDDYIIELIKIAGLVHDLGHGPFSHLFDEWLHNCDSIDKSNELLEHENRSILLLKKIIKETSIIYDEEIFKLNEFIDEDAFKFISEIINPTEITPDNFIFQIISNSLNGLDVDKLDYLCRDSFYFGAGIPYDLSRIISHIKVINNNICFPEKVSYDIYKVFRTRYDLHKQYYNHKTVVSIEYMIRSILEKLDPILNITETIINKKLNKFIELTDLVIFNTTIVLKNFSSIYKLHKENIDYIDNMIERLHKRKMYKCLYSNTYYVDDQSIDDTISDFLTDNSESLNIQKIKPVKLKIGLLSGNKLHPFDNLYFYNNKYDKSFILPTNKISHLMSSFHQEIILYIFYMD